MEKVKPLIGALMAVIVLSGCTSGVIGKQRLTVKLDRVTHKVSPTLYGGFFEDINYGADGGLNAELLVNPFFNYPTPFTGWEFNSNGGKSKITSDSNLNLLNLVVIGEDKHVILRNTGYNGVGLLKDSNYIFKLEGKSSEISSSFTVEVKNKNGETLISKEYRIGNNWEEIQDVFTPNKSVENGEFQIIFKNDANLSFKTISLRPEDTFMGRENGLRDDLASYISNMNPSFFRFPGGCIIEGTSLNNAYNWKDTIGPLDQRKPNKNLWGYMQSYELGFYEYFLFCEDMGAEPLPVVNVGMSCQVRGGNIAPLTRLDSYIQDALDLIEYANGGVDSEWGAKRAEAGHPEPFNLKYIAVGNEQWGNNFFKRYEMFYDEIKANYPDIKIIMGGAGPLAEGDMVDQAYLWAKNGKADIIDEHFYMSPEWFINNTNRYDSYDRNGPKVFLGEYAAHVPNRDNNLYTSLAEAAFMLGMERNSDIVAMASYAPLLAKEDATQWEPDMIRFNNLEVFGTPNYYVQQMFSQNKGDYYIESQVVDSSKPEPIIPIEGMVGFSSWDTRVQYKDLKVTDSKGQVLKDGFGDPETWKNRGTWHIKDGAITGNSGTGQTLFIGDTAWNNYTIEVNAKKDFGKEGFLISFGAKDLNNYYWWNIGGWGNTQSGIEKAQSGIKSNLGTQEPFSVKTDQWYTIKIEVRENRVKCYIDGRLVHNVVDNQNLKPFHSGVTMDNNENIYIKMVNVSKKEQNIDVEIPFDKNMYSNSALVTTLTGDANGVNSFENPKNIYPVESKFKISNNFKYTLNPYSLTIIKVVRNN